MLNEETVHELRLARNWLSRQSLTISSAEAISQGSDVSWALAEEFVDLSNDIDGWFADEQAAQQLLGYIHAMGFVEEVEAYHQIRVFRETYQLVLSRLKRILPTVLTFYQQAGRGSKKYSEAYQRAEHAEALLHRMEDDKLDFEKHPVHFDTVNGNITIKYHDYDYNERELWLDFDWLTDQQPRVLKFWQDQAAAATLSEAQRQAIIDQQIRERQEQQRQQTEAQEKQQLLDLAKKFPDVLKGL